MGVRPRLCKGGATIGLAWHNRQPSLKVHRMMGPFRRLRYMELVYAQRLYRAQSANRPGSAQRRLANQAAYRERKRRERSGRS